MTITRTGSMFAAGLLLGIALFGGISALAPAPAHAYSNTIVNGVFCFLNNFPTTNVFSVTGCGSGTSEPSAELTLVKDVVNDGGGTAAATDWTLSATGPTTISGVTGAGAVTDATVEAGSYTLAESTGPANYTPSAWSCSGASIDGNSLTLASNDDVTCTITNTYVPPAPTTGGLVVEKVVVNSGGGTATPDEFSFQLNGADAVAFNANGENDLSNLAAGPYSVTEVASSTYTSSLSDGCSGSIVAGATSTCTITNTYIPPAPECNSDATQTIVSDTSTTFSGQDGSGPAVPVTMTSITNTYWTASIPGATWIWSTAVVADSTISNAETFTRTFTIVGTPIGATLEIAADNFYSVSINGNDIDAGAGNASDNNFTTAATYNVPAADLVTGTNTLTVVGTNEATPSDSNAADNPAGVLYQLSVQDNECTTPTPASSDLSLTKTVDNSAPTEGSNVTYTLTVHDNGPDTATNVVVTDILPSGLTYVSDDSAGAYNSTTGVWTVGTVTTASDAVLHVVATVGNTTDTITNTASITGDSSTDSNTENNSGSVSVDPVAPSDGGGSEPTATSQTIVVREADLTTNPIASSTSWFFDNDQTNTLDNTLGSFVTGPGTAPLGLGSAQISATSTQGIILDTLAYEGTSLSNVTSLAYSTYRSVGDAPLALALQFDINPNDTVATTSYDGRLVYEPYYTHTVTTDSWQTWNPMDNSTSCGNGNWWFSKGWIATQSGCSQATPCTWAQVLAKYPNIGISDETLFKAGSNWSSDFTGNVDAFVIGVTDGSNATTTTYDFEPDVVVPPVTPPVTPTPSVSGGGGGGGGIIGGPLSFGFGGGGVGGGLVLGTSTEATSQSCGIYLTSYLRMGQKNDATQVSKLQSFLNSYLGTKIPVTGFFGPLTFAAVEKFQTNEGQNVLAPWVPFGLPSAETPTGYVYKTTERRINQLVCSTLVIPAPILP